MMILMSFIASHLTFSDTYIEKERLKTLTPFRNSPIFIRIFETLTDWVIGDNSIELSFPTVPNHEKAFRSSHKYFTRLCLMLYV